jgi:hypothetical protein
MEAAALDDTDLRPDIFNLVLPPEYLTDSTGDED